MGALDESTSYCDVASTIHTFPFLAHHKERKDGFRLKRHTKSVHEPRRHLHQLKVILVAVGVVLLHGSTIRFT